MNEYFWFSCLDGQYIPLISREFTFTFPEIFHYLHMATNMSTSFQLEEVSIIVLFIKHNFHTLFPCLACLSLYRNNFVHCSTFHIYQQCTKKLNMFLKLNECKQTNFHDPRHCPNSMSIFWSVKYQSFSRSKHGLLVMHFWILQTRNLLSVYIHSTLGTCLTFWCIECRYDIYGQRK